MTTAEKAKQIGMSTQGLEKAVKRGRIEVSAITGTVKGFEEHTTIKQRERKKAKECLTRAVK